MFHQIQSLLVNDVTVGGALVLVGAVHFVGGGLSDMMEKTLFGYSWLTVGRVLSLVPLCIGVATSFDPSNKLGDPVATGVDHIWPARQNTLIFPWDS